MEQEHFEMLYPDTAYAQEIQTMLNFIKEGNSCQVLGLPGSGRSTLLNLLAYNRKVRLKHLGKGYQSFHFVLINFSEIRKRSLIDVMKFLFLNLTESLRERRMMVENKVVGDIFREHLKFQDELILYQGFKEAIDYLCLEKDITVVFLFDRFEEYIPTVTGEFFSNLRTLRNRAKYKFSVVFSVYRPLETTLESSILADFYEFVAEHLLYLKLADQHITDFRIAYIEKIIGKHLAKEVYAAIIKLTGGAGRLTKLAVEAVLANGQHTKALASFLLNQKSLRSALLEIWSIFTPAEQSDLLAGKFDDAQVNRYLEQIGMLQDKKITIPLFANFIQEKFIKAQGEQSVIIYDQNTNAIRKGADVLSDSLTSLEFRMLRYFLQNQNRIIERDELINVVWEGNKSTAGITDQAVDQLIFRLRHKIETDTNNPQHLQTVKGRGFRFLP